MYSSYCTWIYSSQSSLNKSAFYHVVGGLPPDAMHDILEGVLHYGVKEMLKQFVKIDHYLTTDDLNYRISNYDFGYYNDKNKPMPITDQKLSSNDNSLKQHVVQMWCLATHLPLLIGDLIPKENERWHIFILLLEITAICLSPAISKEQVEYLQVLVRNHHEQFHRLYPNCTITPKMHFMIHMPSYIMSLGPLVRSWCMRFEAKHHYFKKLCTVIGNFKNLPYSLTMRHQQWVCYKLQSTGNQESSFLEKGIEMGSGSAVPAADLEYYESLKEYDQNVGETTSITRPKWIIFHGTTYKIGCVLWVSHDEEETPCFACLKEIYVTEGNLQRIWQVVTSLHTEAFNKHLNAFEVTNTLNVELVQQQQLPYTSPLHLITITDEQQIKTMVCPKYQCPV